MKNEQERQLEMAHMDASNVFERFKGERVANARRSVAWELAFYEAKQEAERTGQAHFDYRFQLQQAKMRATSNVRP